LTPDLRRSLEHVELAEGGFLAFCDCGTPTLVLLTTAEGTSLPPVDIPLQDLAFTCEGCLSTHWFRFGQVSQGPEPGQ
jgi:hypothetical protein